MSDQILKSACPHCRGRFEFPASAGGAVIACPHCGKQLQLPAPKQPAAAPAVPASKHAAAPPTPPAAPAEHEEAVEAPRPKRKLSKGVIFGIAGGVGVLLIAGVLALVLTKKSGAPGKPGKDLEVVEYQLQKAKEGGLVYVVGTVTNHADIQYFTVRVEFDLHDKDGTWVGNTSDYKGNIGPREAWHFKALVLEENAAEAKLMNLLAEKE